MFAYTWKRGNTLKFNWLRRLHPIWFEFDVQSKYVLKHGDCRLSFVHVLVVPVCVLPLT